MVGVTLSSPKVTDDLVKWETNHAFTRDAAVGGILNTEIGATVALDDPIGLPLQSDGAGGYAFAVVGDEAAVIAVIMAGPKLAIVAPAARTDTGLDEYVVLKLGPAIINKDALELGDIDGTGTLSETGVLAALAALNIEAMAEPTNIDTQII